MQYKDLGQEYARLSPVVDAYKKYLDNEERIENAEHFLKDDDSDVKELAEDEVEMCKAVKEELLLKQIAVSELY